MTNARGSGVKLAIPTIDRLLEEAGGALNNLSKLGTSSLNPQCVDDDNTVNGGLDGTNTCSAASSARTAGNNVCASDADGGQECTAAGEKMLKITGVVRHDDALFSSGKADKSQFSSASSKGSGTDHGNSNSTEWLSSVFSEVKGLVKSAMSIPGGEEYSVRSSSSLVSKEIQDISEKSVLTISELINYSVDPSTLKRAFAKPKIKGMASEDDIRLMSNQITQDFDIFLDCLESLLDKVDVGLKVDAQKLTLSSSSQSSSTPSSIPCMRDFLSKNNTLFLSPSSNDVANYSGASIKQSPSAKSCEAFASGFFRKETCSAQAFQDQAIKDTSPGFAVPRNVAASSLHSPSDSSTLSPNDAFREPQNRWRPFFSNFRPFFVPRITYKENAVVPIPQEIINAQLEYQTWAETHNKLLTEKSVSSVLSGNQFAGFLEGANSQRNSTVSTEQHLQNLISNHPLHSHLNSLGLDEVLSANGNNSSTEHTPKSSTHSLSSFKESARSLPHPYSYELGLLEWRDCWGSSELLNTTKFEDENRNAPMSSNNSVNAAENTIQRGLGLCKITPPVIPKRFSDTPLVLVTNSQELQEMVDELSSVGNDIIGIDLEHHSIHSYYGFVCLIQISNKKKDWIIDPFDLFEELHILNKFTTNPAILKVLHGAERDVLWLQRDFGVYLVNMFDTGQAARVLNVPGGLSLANLLIYYCDYKTDKKFQLADWRQRPLSSEMLLYARADTHFLPYLYEVMRNQLLSYKQAKPYANTHPLLPLETYDDTQITDGGCELFLMVMKRSREICLRTYEDELYDPLREARYLSSKLHSEISYESQMILARLLEWRDILARQSDESRQSIMNDHILFRIASARPTSFSQLSMMFHPLPRAVKYHGSEIIRVLTEAIAHPEGPPLASAYSRSKEEVKSLEVVGQMKALDVHAKVGNAVVGGDYSSTGLDKKKVFLGDSIQGFAPRFESCYGTSDSPIVIRDCEEFSIADATSGGKPARRSKIAEISIPEEALLHQFESSSYLTEAAKAQSKSSTSSGMSSAEDHVVTSVTFGEDCSFDPLEMILLLKEGDASLPISGSDKVEANRRRNFHRKQCLELQERVSKPPAPPVTPELQLEIKNSARLSKDVNEDLYSQGHGVMKKRKLDDMPSHDAVDTMAVENQKSKQVNLISLVNQYGLNNKSMSINKKNRRKRQLRNLHSEAISNDLDELSIECSNFYNRSNSNESLCSPVKKSKHIFFDDDGNQLLAAPSDSANIAANAAYDRNYSQSDVRIQGKNSTIHKTLASLDPNESKSWLPMTMLSKPPALLSSVNAKLEANSKNMAKSSFRKKKHGRK